VAGAFGLARIEEKDQDALGLLKVVVVATEADSSEPADEKKVWEKLKEVFDPEIPVNVVDLGLVYSVELKPLATGGSRAEVKMTLTALVVGWARRFRRMHAIRFCQWRG
jgi:hypothetical protein